MATVRRGLAVTWESKPGERVTFACAPPDGLTDARVLERMNGIGAPEKMADLEFIAEQATTYVREWTGVQEEDGSPAPCDEETRRAFFRQHLLAAVAVWVKLAEARDPDRPPVPGAGSDGSAAVPGSASTAEASSLATSEGAPI